MASAFDARHAKQQQYRFPLSPPSSGNATALSSPKLTPTLHDPNIVDKLFAVSKAPAFRQSHSLVSVRSGKQRALSNATDSDGYNTEKTPSQIPARKRPRKVMSRALTLPSGLAPHLKNNKTASPKSARPLLRTASVSSSGSSASSSSGPTDREENLAHHTNPGIGRKVAATLRLFKETTSEEPASAENSSRSESSRVEPFPDVEDVAEAFEFVKRSEWADRETAAIRRERSMTAPPERSQGREGVSEPGVGRKIPSKDPVVDVAQWRRDLAMARGRRRERASDDLDEHSEVPLSTINTFHETSPIYIRPRSRAYPPSPSPSRSPTSRISVSHHHSHEPPVTSLPCPEPTPLSLSIRTTPRNSRSPTPVRSTHHPDISYSAPISPLEPISPWSTDDESTWETASATSTAASNTSLHGPEEDTPHPPFSSTLLQQSPGVFDHHLSGFPSLDDGEALNNAPLKHLDNGTLSLDVDLPEERLPHIPLKPFRNQVGGHSAIYKFTKQAVCKVRTTYSITFHIANVFIP